MSWGLARGRGRRSSQILADERNLIAEYDAAVFVLGNFKDCIVNHKTKLFEELEIPVAVVCGPEVSDLPCEAVICGVGRKVERMRREEEIQKLQEASEAIERIIHDKRAELDEDPLFIHPAEIKSRLDELEPIKDCLRPAPVVLHLDGLRVKIPYEQWKDTIADIEIYGHRLGDVATISESSLGGSILIKIKTMSEVNYADAHKA